MHPHDKTTLVHAALTTALGLALGGVLAFACVGRAEAQRALACTDGLAWHATGLPTVRLVGEGRDETIRLDGNAVTMDVAALPDRTAVVCRYFVPGHPSAVLLCDTAGTCATRHTLPLGARLVGCDAGTARGVTSVALVYTDPDRAPRLALLELVPNAPARVVLTRELPSQAYDVLIDPAPLVPGERIAAVAYSECLGDLDGCTSPLIAAPFRLTAGPHGVFVARQGGLVTLLPAGETLRTSSLALDECGGVLTTYDGTVLRTFDDAPTAIPATATAPPATATARPTATRAPSPAPDTVTLEPGACVAVCAP